MNSTILNFVRDSLKEGLSKCTEAEQNMFKRFYAKGNLELPINEVVDNMPDEKLDWALLQVERTLEKKQNGWYRSRNM